MKKIFSIIAASVTAGILIFISVLCFVKKNVYIEYGTPERIYIYYKSTTDTASFDSTNKKFDKLLAEIKNMTKMSLFNRLVHLNTLNTEVYQDLDGKYSKWETTMKQDNLVIELYFGTKLQDSIVYYEKDSKVVSYYYLTYVIPTSGNLNEMAVYFCDTTDSTASVKDKNYQSHKPLIITGYNKNIIKFVESL